MSDDDSRTGTTQDTPGFDEDALIERIGKRFPPARKPTLGIGDDAAILEDPRPAVITTDLLVEGIDFLPDTPRWFVGRKALAANLSDLAAMGAEPDAFLLTLGLPRAQGSSIDELIEGMASRAQANEIELAGGDLSESERLLVSITAIGRIRADRALLRSNARVGDSLFVSRPLGGSAAGLELLLRGWRMTRNMEVSSPAPVSYQLRELGGSLLRAQLDPEPEIELGLTLSELETVGACIDLSDGVSRDLARVCKSSGVGAVIEWDRVPVLPDLDRLGGQLGIDPLRCALHGGEEFSLLFTARSGEARLSTLLGRPVYRIGSIDGGEGVRLSRGGSIEPLPNLGFDHFRETS